MNNTGKSWLGAPTINRVTPTWTSWGIDGSGTVNIGTRTILSDWHCRINDYNHNTRQSIYVTGLSGSTTYTFSVKFKKLEGAPTLRFQLQSYNGGTFLGAVFPTTVQLGLSDKEGWQTAYYSYTTASGADRVLWFMQDGDDYTTYTHSFELKEPQCEQQSFVTPFVSGTRSNTQALVDLTGNNTLTLTSLTYASNGTFSFNGSNRINFTMTGSASLTAYTRIVWIKPTASSSDMKSVMLNTIGNNSDMAVGIANGYATFHQYTNSNGTGVNGDLNISGSTPISLNQTYMIAVTVDRSITTNNVKVYLNGSLDGTGSRNLGTSSSDAVILGGPASDDYGGSRMFYGTVYSAKQYNRILTPVEIKQNFNAHRGRYGL